MDFLGGLSQFRAFCLCTSVHNAAKFQVLLYCLMATDFVTMMGDLFLLRTNRKQLCE